MSTQKMECKHWFQTMCVSGDRDTSLSMYKAMRQHVRGISLTARDVRAWLRSTGIGLELVSTYKDNGSKVYCVYVHLPHEWESPHARRHPTPHMIEDTSYSQCMYKLAFKVLAYKWDMSLSQIHEVEAWSFPSVSRTKKV